MRLRTKDGAGNLYHVKHTGPDGLSTPYTVGPEPVTLPDNVARRFLHNWPQYIEEIPGGTEEAEAAQAEEPATGDSAQGPEEAAPVVYSWPCKTCGEVLPSAAQLRRHKRDKHTNK